MSSAADGDGSAPRADRGFLRSARTVSLLTLLSRVLGLLRDRAMGHVLGAGMVHDALVFAWTVPNAFRRLFGEGALGSAFVPVFTRTLDRDGPERARSLANELISGLAVFLALLAGGLVLLVSLVPLDAWASLFDGNLAKAALTVRYIQMLLPYLAVICVVAQFVAVLQARGQFAVPALSPSLLNLVWLGGVGVAALWASDREPGEELRATQGTIVVGAILLASVLQLLWHLPALKAVGMGFRLRRPRASPELRGLLHDLAPMLLGMGSAQLNVLADRTIAMAWLADGGTTHLYFGMRVMQFPLGLVSVALVTAVYPALARLMARDDRSGATATAHLALRTNMLVAAPAAVGLVLLAEPVVSLLFESGEFGPRSSLRASEALAGYAVGIPFAGLVMLLNRASYAAGDTSLPLRVGLTMVGVNIALDLVLVRGFGELGLATATSITSLLTAAALLVGVGRRYGALRGRALLGGLLSPLLVAAVMGVGVLVVDRLVSGVVGQGTGDDALRVACGVATGLVIFVLAAPPLCPDAWRELSALWKRSPTGER